MAGRIVYRDAQGRVLTEEDLRAVTGRVRWELVGDEAVPAEARRLHREGREAGGRGAYESALALLEQAWTLAPQWPYPVYDAAFTVLLQGAPVRAEELYARVDRLAPRGFFTCKTTLDVLRRELRGELFDGFSRAFVQLEWVEDPAAKRAALHSITTRFPGFPPAWNQLSQLLTDHAERAAAVERGLAGDPDPETRGALLINRALLLKRTDPAATLAALGLLALDPDSTLGTETGAKVVLAQLVRFE
ncbi:hypothetical protein Kpho02_28660 [Kitasatospora phosalacinea]|uniref:Tetratricopeptide repeat protein n=1 Tax=Kitasatospora phosalacinea TaxID=2065 RepID=A0A9W6Q629_9ACTN|nr:hypothetical protein [Kitasatospora phosalacinea]GLW70567.1 hypothetical protein Kpho02_28660 [Kitasatospora phosalacinea]